MLCSNTLGIRVFLGHPRPHPTAINEFLTILIHENRSGDNRFSNPTIPTCNVMHIDMICTI